MRVCVCEGGEQRSNARFVLLYERKREREIVRGVERRSNARFRVTV